MTTKTVKLDDGKYQFDLDEQTGMMLAARRNGEPWPVAFDEWRFSKCFMAALSRIVELEEGAAEPGVLPKTFVEAAARYSAAKAQFDERFGAEIERAAQRSTSCTLGVGCDEAGVCFAMANNKPEECGAPVEKCAFCGRIADDVCETPPVDICEKAINAAPPANPAPSVLAVWYGSMPESNGKTNWTAILHRGDIVEGVTLDRSEHSDRVRYEADRVRYLIGEIDKRPCILDYDADKHSGYVPRDAAPRDAQPVALLEMIDNNIASLGNIATAAEEKSLNGLSKALRKTIDTLERCKVQQGSIEALEQLRPVWAMTEAEPQVVAAALSSVWKLLGASNQTEAVQKLRALLPEFDRKTQQIDALLAHCPDGECATCAEIVCPHKCTMHFHHDGCPACAEHEAEGAPT